MLNKPESYVGIAVWGKALYSFGYYIKGQQAAAAAAGAPIDALYYSDSEGKWVCVSDLKPDHQVRVLYAKALGPVSYVYDGEDEAYEL